MYGRIKSSATVLLFSSLNATLLVSPMLYIHAFTLFGTDQWVSGATSDSLNG